MEKKKQRSIVTIVIYFQVMEEEIIRHSINAHPSKPAQPAKKAANIYRALSFDGSHIQQLTDIPIQQARHYGNDRSRITRVC